MSGCPARFGENPGDKMAVERQCLRRQNLGRDENDRLVELQVRLMFDAVEVAEDAADHVAQVGHAFLQVRIGDLGEQLVVFVEDLAQGGGGVDLAFLDGGLDLGAEGRVAQQQAMGAKDGGLVLTDLLADALDAGVQLAGDGRAGAVETTDFAGQGGGVEVEGFLLEQNMVHAEGAGHGHSRRYGQASFHGRSLRLSV